VAPPLFPRTDREGMRGTAAGRPTTRRRHLARWASSEGQGMARSRLRSFRTEVGEVMAATVTNTAETKPQAPRPGRAGHLAVASLLGAASLVAAVAAVFYGVPRLWAAYLNPALAGWEFVSYAVLILLMGGVAAALAYLGRQLVGAQPPAG